MDSIAARAAAVQERIAGAARRAGRTTEEIRLVGVTKTHPPEVVVQALAAGLFDFGENRVQEAEAKIAALAPERSRITWHLIGHLQRNKAKKAAMLFDIVHSLDSLSLAETLNRYAAEDGRSRIEDKRTPSSIFHPRASILDSLQPLPALLQVNVSGETSKEGFNLWGWEERSAVLDKFLVEVEALLALRHIWVCGLMTIAPWVADPELARPTFRSARRLRDELARRFPHGDWAMLSMGMTDDFDVAIEEGATVVRVGRAIFGERENAENSSN